MSDEKVLITKEIEIDMGHRVPNHKSKCRNLHGHRYKLEVGVYDKVITKEGESDEGMVIDFGDLKEIMMNEIDGKFDHGFMIYIEDAKIEQFEKWREEGEKIIPVNFVPTAENIAKFWFEILVEKLKEQGIQMEYIKVWETPTSTAKYTYKNYVATIM